MSPSDLAALRELFHSNRQAGGTAIALSQDKADALLARVDELEEKLAKKNMVEHFGWMIFDLLNNVSGSGDLPEDDNADKFVNAWLRMRAERDEAKADAARRIDELRAMLKRVEFAKEFCPVCDGDGEHWKGCELAALLKEPAP